MMLGTPPRPSTDLSSQIMMINVGRSGLSGGMNFTAPLSLHPVERRKHRRVVRLSEEICDTRKAIFVVSQDCRCGKKCLDRKDVDLSEVLEIIKHLRRQTFGRSYEDIFTSIRHKLEGEDMYSWHFLFCS